MALRVARFGSPVRAGGESAALRMQGNSSVNVVPTAGWLVTRIRPPWLRTMPCTAASPSPRPAGLVVKNGIEDAVEGLGIHAGARVAHLEPDVVAGRQAEHSWLMRRRGLARPQRSCAGRDADSPSVLADRFGGVGEQVHHHLSQLRRVAGDHRQPSREIVADGDGRRDDRPEQLTHLLDEFFERDRHHDEPAASRVGEHLRRELAGTQRGALDAFDVLASRRSGRQIRECEAGLAEDADEQVVEVVRHAAGQHAEALEALRLLDAIVERSPFALGAFPFEHLVTQGSGAFVDEALQILLVPPPVSEPPSHEAGDDQGDRREWPAPGTIRSGRSVPAPGS